TFPSTLTIFPFYVYCPPPALHSLPTRRSSDLFVEVSYADGSKEVLHFSDFASGAMIHNIVDRAKKAAIKSLLETGQRGLRPEHFEAAIAEEFSEHEDLPNTTNPDEWARIS